MLREERTLLVGTDLLSSEMNLPNASSNSTTCASTRPYLSPESDMCALKASDCRAYPATCTPNGKEKRALEKGSDISFKERTLSVLFWHAKRAVSVSISKSYVKRRNVD
jgi:hypothetical protein